MSEQQQQEQLLNTTITTTTTATLEQQEEEQEEQDLAESHLLHQLFRENNELRAKYNAAQRELYNKTVQVESVEDELRLFKLNKDDGKTKSSQPASSHRLRRLSRLPSVASSTSDAPLGQQGLSKELEEATFAIESKNAEIKRYKEETNRYQMTVERQKADLDEAEKSLRELKEELHDTRAQRSSSLKAESEKGENAPESTGTVIAVMQKKLDAAEETAATLKRQLLELATDANKRHNEQQNQLQGVEALLDVVKHEYGEFLRIQHLENLEYRNTQQVEYDRLKKMFEDLKIDQHEERKKLMFEYQGLMYSLQAQFEEYRSTAEFLFNVEVTKLEDELTNQAMRYEQEIMYIVQAKDRFYSELMVGKDAKIMSLIEGSDLQSLMQKHEMDIEALRKEHGREIDRVKSDQESEQKNLIGLLQRQNSSLDAKTEKLQAHIKTLEVRIKDLLSTIDTKTRLITEREEMKLKSDAEFQRQLDAGTQKINSLSQEKEHLRHKVIRLNLDARGDGENTIENMLKRITRETTEVQSSFDEISTKYDFLVAENQSQSKRLKEKEQLATFLEKEIKRRNKEMATMTETFESFLMARARQASRARKLRIADRDREKQKDWDMRGKEEGGEGPLFTLVGKAPRETAMSAEELVASLKQRERDIVPMMTTGRRGSIAFKGKTPEFLAEKSELERGYAYLRRFKTLSRAFVTGDFRQIPAMQGGYDAGTGTFQKVSISNKQEFSPVSVPRLYQEKNQLDEFRNLSGKPTIYNPNDATGREGQEKPHSVSRRTTARTLGTLQHLVKPITAHMSPGNFSRKDSNLPTPVINGHVQLPFTNDGSHTPGPGFEQQHPSQPQTPRIMRGGAWTPSALRAAKTPVTIPGAAVERNHPDSARLGNGSIGVDLVGMPRPFAKTVTPEKNRPGLTPVE